MIAKLIIASGKRAGRAISMKRDKLLIGRAEECDLRPLSEEVSRRHCAIVKKEEALWAEDLRSRNGTFVNGLRISGPQQLADGDLVRVGSLELKISVAADPPLETEEDISRLLLGGEEPVGGHDTTRSLEAVEDSAIVHETADSGKKAGAEATLVSSDDVANQSSDDNVNADDDSSISHHGRAVEEILKSRSKPGQLPKGSKADGSSRDAAAEALRKYFGNR